MDVNPQEEVVEYPQEEVEEDLQERMVEDPWDEAVGEFEHESSASLLEVDSTCGFTTSSSQQPTPMPLYDGSLLNVPQSNVLIYKFAMKHNLSIEGLSDILKLIQLHCPTPNNCVRSAYLLCYVKGESQCTIHL